MNVLKAQWEVLRNRLRSHTALVALVGVGALSVYAVVRLFGDQGAPGPDAMTTFAAVDVGLLIALAIEEFSPRLPTMEARRMTVAGRTGPTAFALLLALLGVVAQPSQEMARWIVAIAFVLTASGVLSVIFSAFDRAEVLVAGKVTSHVGDADHLK